MWFNWTKKTFVVNSDEEMCKKKINGGIIKLEIYSADCRKVYLSYNGKDQEINLICQRYLFVILIEEVMLWMAGIQN